MAWFAHDNDTPLSKKQYLVLVIVSHVSAALSLFGSSCIIYKAVKSKQLRRSTYHRLLFSLSTADILLSSAFFAHPVSPSNRFRCTRFALLTTSNILFLILFSFDYRPKWVLPSSTGYPWAIGSRQTCTAAGFVLRQSCVAVIFYNCFLSCYFFATIHYRWQRSTVTKLERWAQAMVLFIVLGTGFTTLAVKGFNPTDFGRMCSDKPNQPDCDSDQFDSAECIKSTNPVALAVTSVLSFTILISVLMSLYTTSSVYRAIRKRYQTSLAMGFASHNGISTSSAHEARVRKVAKQAVLYALAYFNTFFWLACWTVIEEGIYHEHERKIRDGEPHLYAIQVLYSLLVPLQGFLNCFVYMWPQITRWKEMNPGRSVLFAFWQTLSSASPSSHLNNRRNMPLNNTTEENSGLGPFRRSIQNAQVLRRITPPARNVPEEPEPESQTQPIRELPKETEPETHIQPASKEPETQTQQVHEVPMEPGTETQSSQEEPESETQTQPISEIPKKIEPETHIQPASTEPETQTKLVGKVPKPAEPGTQTQPSSEEPEPETQTQPVCEVSKEPEPGT